MDRNGSALNCHEYYKNDTAQCDIYPMSDIDDARLAAVLAVAVSAEDSTVQAPATREPPGALRHVV